MEKKQGSPPATASPFTAELFGIKESPPSNGIFDSIFSPPSPVPGRKSGGREAAMGSWQKPSSGNQTTAMSGQSASYSNPNKDRSSLFHEESLEPFNSSASIYYGAQDNYSQSSPYNVGTGRPYPILKEDGGENELSTSQNSQSASRGNWWEGSLYY